jgi:hypothetical protein
MKTQDLATANRALVLLVTGVSWRQPGAIPRGATT